MRPLSPALLLSAVCLLGLGGCEQLGIETPAVLAAKKEADSKAIGGACRHAGRAIEDCYTLNGKADKAAMYTGWREMNEYMRENKIDPVVPVIPRDPPKPPKPAVVASAPASSPDDEDAPEPRAAKPKKGAH